MMNYSKVNTLIEFVIEINKETRLDLNISSLRKMNNTIPKEELSRFLTDSKITEAMILNVVGIELDWNLSALIIETAEFYILRVWEVTA